MNSKEPIAIVGMACMFPGAENVTAYWQNILSAKDCITDIPAERDRVRQDAVLLKGDEITCTKGGFLPELHRFYPADYGIMPGICEKVDPEQMLILETVDQALEDAGIHPEQDDLNHTEIILGRGGYLGNYLQQVHMRVEVIPQVLSVLRKLQPDLDHDMLGRVADELQSVFSHLNADRIPFGIPNIATGRVANRFNCMGGNYTIDAACASALVAADNSIAALQSGRADRVITGGVFLAGNPSFQWTFSRLGALSPTNIISPFSNNADGMLVGEGLGMLVLEPLSAAEKAGRRIYALLRGSATSSDGRGNAVLAPRHEGQMTCLDRAYSQTGIDPHSISLIEGHGTGTPAGDQVELLSITGFFKRETNGIPVQALGSVKSMIGHLMPAAGAAAMIKTALALYHRILPPTLHAENPAEALQDSTIYLNDQTRPWVRSPLHPRRAGVNAFGFGGINAHVIMEETNPDSDTFTDLPLEWPTELFLFSAADRSGLVEQINDLRTSLPGKTTSTTLADFSYKSCKKWRFGLEFNLTIVADRHNIIDLLDQAGLFLLNEQLKEPEAHSNIFFTDKPLGRHGKVVFIFPGNAFPGLGDDYTARLAQLSCYLPFFRRWFDLLDSRNTGNRPYPFSTMLFSPPGLNQQRLVALKKELRQLTNSAAGVFVANSAGQDLMLRLGVNPDMVTGTSLGEWSALMAGGALGFEDIAAMGSHLAGKDGREIIGGLGLARCSIALLKPVLAEVDGTSSGRVDYALDLSPVQVVFGGDRPAVQEVSKKLQNKGIWAEAFNMTPIHTPLCAPIADSQHEIIDQLSFKTPQVPVYSGATGKPYPVDINQARTLLADNTVLPVRMRSLFSRLYNDGGRIFLQLGGGGKILGPLRETLADKPFFATSLDMPDTHPATQLQRVTGALIAHGLELKPDIFFQYRKNLMSDNKENTFKKGPEAILEMAVPKLAVQTVPDRKAVIKNTHTEAAATTDKNDKTSPAVIMSRQLEIAGRILNLQQQDEIIDAETTLRFLKQQQMIILGDNPEINAANDLPFISRIVEHTVHKKMVIEHILDVSQDCFLLDHTFIPCPEHIKKAEERFPTLPMAVSLEIMAEAAVALLPGQTVTALENISNKHWIHAGRLKHQVTLTVTVEHLDLTPDGMKRLTCRIMSNIDKNILHVSGEIIMDKSRPQATPTNSGKLISARPCRLDPASLYRHNRLYHGPCFQGIDQLQQYADNGIQGIITVPATTNFFSSDDRGEFILAPGAIDVASQLIACWAWEREDHIWVAPVAVQRMELFGPTPKPGEKLQTTLLIRKSETKTLTFDLIMEQQGQIRCKITGWQDYLMGWPDRFLMVWQHAATSFLSDPLVSAEKNDCSIRHLTHLNLEGVNLEWVAHLFLHKDELSLFSDYDPTRQKSWLLGRIAAKDAIRIELEQRTGISGLYPSQIKITTNGTGQPQVKIISNEQNIPCLHISISHKENEAVAVASVEKNPKRTGINP